MKNLFIAITIASTTLAACNSAANRSADNKNRDDSNKVENARTTDTTKSKEGSSKVVDAMGEMVNQYLNIKNALANDNGETAATAGNAFVVAMGKMKTTTLTVDKKKAWDNLADDAKEMAEHIGKNADKLEHQREHFDMLSSDMYDMVKVFGGGQTLYQDFCPMYNNKKGATWLSETKEIKNPYLGKKMPVCGSVKEEIK